MSSYKIFLGTEPGQWLPAEVLKYSILKRTSLPIEFHDTRFFPQSQRVKRIKGASLDRLWIPEVCNYQGKAIYMEPAALVFADVKELFEMPMQNKGALACPMNPQMGSFYTDLLVLDCAQLTNWKASEWLEQINTQPSLYHELFFIHSKSPIHHQFGPLPHEWYHIDQWIPGTKLLEFKNEMIAPWKSSGHPQKQLFIDELNNAIKDKFIPRDALEREVDWKQAYPKLLEALS